MQVIRYNKEANLVKANVQGEYIAVIGEQAASLERRMSDGRDTLLNKIDSGPEGQGIAPS
ncbi:MAG: hypothetical protein LBJ79_01380 [Endomicrobium sp.]|nr:hypothetical protein [Endomicrobium sp.]